jgi:hypothetical protein
VKHVTKEAVKRKFVFLLMKTRLTKPVTKLQIQNPFMVISKSEWHLMKMLYECRYNRRKRTKVEMREKIWNKNNHCV